MILPTSMSRDKYNPIKNRKAHCESFNTNDIVNKNTQVTDGGSSSINYFNKYQSDMLAYTYPYHMQKVDRMKPYDYQATFITSEDMNTLENKVTHFNSRHHLIQLKFNVYDSNHRPSCFKKGPECSTELPNKHNHADEIHFDGDKCITWHFIDVSTKNSTFQLPS